MSRVLQTERPRTATRGSLSVRLFVVQAWGVEPLFSTTVMVDRVRLHAIPDEYIKPAWD